MNYIKKIIALACFSALSMQAMHGTKELLVPSDKSIVSSTEKPSLNPGLTADEVAEIHIRCISNVWWNRSLISPNFEKMAHGNTELANELRGLYECPGYITAMLTFNGLCQKWGFDTSKVNKD